MHPHVDPEAVGGEEGLAAALLVADERVLPSVGLLVGAQVAGRAVGAGAALKGALVPLYLADGAHRVRGQRSCPAPNAPRSLALGRAGERDRLPSSTQKAPSNTSGESFLLSKLHRGDN